MRTKVFLSIFIALSLFGCKSPTDSVQSTQLFSLQKAWIYSTQTFDLNGTVGAPSIDSVYIDSTMIHNGKTNYFLSNNNVIIVDSTGLMTGYDLTGCLCETFQIPGITGDTILRRDSIPTKVNGKVAFGTIIIFVKNADTSITVPAGTFMCEAYEIQILANNILTGSSALSYISPTVGLVESDSYTTDTTTGKVFLTSREQLIRTIK